MRPQQARPAEARNCSRMRQRNTDLTHANAVARQCGMGRLTITAVRHIPGGMVSQVEEWLTDGEPGAIICKCSEEGKGPAARREIECLRWVREHTRFPVPQGYGWVAYDGATYTLMERLAGRHLGIARLSEAGREALEEQLAMYLAGLHEHRGEGYGYLGGSEQTATWQEHFAPRLEENYRDAAPRLSAGARAAIERLLSDLPDWLPECGAPTLVHGDVWENNLIVDDADPDRPRLTGFIDGAWLYADVESELAYLMALGTWGERLLSRYARYHPLREGFARRCRVYWLNTMLLHLWLFGEQHRARCEELAAEVNRDVRGFPRMNAGQTT
jgi:fructosamine-3-kinase